VAKIQSATSIDQNPDQERNTRIKRYTIAMLVRMVCLVLGVVFQGPFMWLFFAAAIFLPYFAVVMANIESSPPRGSSMAVAPTLTLKPESASFQQEDDLNPPNSPSQ